MKPQILHRVTSQKFFIKQTGMLHKNVIRKDLLQHYSEEPQKVTTR